MPIIQVIGLEANQKTIQNMLVRIPDWVASVRELDIYPKNVTAFFIPSTQVNPGDHIVFYVQELFEKSLNQGLPRTAETRKKLCRAIMNGFNEFIKSAELLVFPSKGTVVIRRVNVEEGEYNFWYPHPYADEKGELPDDGHNFINGVESGPRD